MEDGLVLINLLNYIQNGDSLNPYCSGRWSRTVKRVVLDISQVSLNPYCSGRWSRTPMLSNVTGSDVLILIVVEDGLVPPNPYFMATVIVKS